jgi:alpha-glucosidase/oligosaccharide 4-alpha-D-glucosyltransferase
VRAGAFIPMAKVVQTTRDYNTASIELHYWHDASVRSAAGKLYDDDGLTAQAYEQGKYELLHFTSKLEGKALSLRGVSEVGKQHQRPERAIALTVHNVRSAPSSVRVDGKVAVFAWDQAGKQLSVQLPAGDQASRSVDISL